MIYSISALTSNDVLVIFNSAFFILGGVAVFMVGMNMMGASLEAAAGKSMRRLMAKATGNRFLGGSKGRGVNAMGGV